MTIPETMRAIAIDQPGGPEVLEPIETDVPQSAADEVLVRVRAAGINRPDILQREGRYPLPPEASPLPGLEIGAAYSSRINIDAEGFAAQPPLGPGLAHRIRKRQASGLPLV